jgi:hypothetical protein
MRGVNALTTLTAKEDVQLLERRERLAPKCERVWTF